jgi:hypothetical protein
MEASRLITMINIFGNIHQYKRDNNVCLILDNTESIVNNALMKCLDDQNYATLYLFNSCNVGSEILCPGH